MKPLTPTQTRLLAEALDHKGEKWSPLEGAEVASARALERQGRGIVASTQDPPRYWIEERGWFTCPAKSYFIWDRAPARSPL